MRYFLKDNQHKNEKGFSLVELMIALAIFSLIFTVAINFGSNIFGYNTFLSAQTSAQQQAKKVVKEMMAQIRSMSPSSVGDFPLAQGSSQSLTFFVNLDSDSYIERVRYFIDGSKLKRGIIKPTGSPLVYNPANESVSIAFSNLTSTSTVFTYYDVNYTGFEAPLAQPISVNQVKVVGVVLSIDVDPNKSPVSLEISSKAEIRNLKSN